MTLAPQVDVDVLVVGAGPVGTALALQAQQHGARVHLIERRSDLSRPSRAMLLWPRTLEALDRLGVADRLQAHPAARLRACLHLGRRESSVALAALAVPGHRRPPLMVRQADVEQVLHRAASLRGIPFSTGTELSGLRVDTAAVTAVMSTPEGTRQVRCSFVVGCDGAESAVRRLGGIPWNGRTYRQEAVLADLHLDGLTPTVAHIGAGPAGVGFLFPAGEHGAGWRLVATRVARGHEVPPGRNGPAVSVPTIQGVLRGANLPGRVEGTAWSTRVRLQRRRAVRFRAGPVFLAGDAAHVVSPAGAQGLNTGLQDATNLGWKLAAAVGGSADPEALLTSYERERLPVARQVGLLTGLLLRGEGDERQPFRSVRTLLLPAVAPLVPALLRFRPLTAVGGWVLAQGWVAYAVGQVTQPTGPRVPRRLRAGRWAPDLDLVVDGRRASLRNLLSAPGVHVLHGAALDASDLPDRPGVTMHRVESWPGRRVVVVRPDGYIGLADQSGDMGRLLRWLDVFAPRAAARHDVSA